MSKIDPLDDALVKADALMVEAVALLEPQLGVLTDEQRTHLLSAPDDLAKAVNSMLAEGGLLARIAPMTPTFDPATTKADLAYAAKVAPLVNRAAHLSRIVGDALRAREAKVYGDVLTVYNVAKAGAESDATLLPLVKPLRDVYDARKKPTKKT